MIEHDSGLHPFERAVAMGCRRESLMPNGSRVIVAVSGGPDSLAMLYALVAIAGSPPRWRLRVAHLDHGARGARGAADARYVAGVAARLGLPFTGGRLRRMRRRGASWESAAREARYAFLAKAAARWRADRIAVGHTADDQAETVLHRLCRGCGLPGAAAMAPARRLDRRRSSPILVRPLLALTRDDVNRYLRDRRIDARLDETNRRLDWTRNRIRLRILPRLSRDVHPGATRALARFAGIAGAAARLIASLADAWERKVGIRSDATDTRVSWRQFAAVHEAVRAELWIRMLRRADDGRMATQSEIESLESLLRDRGGCRSLRGGRIAARRDGRDLIMTRCRLPRTRLQPGRSRRVLPRRADNRNDPDRFGDPERPLDSERGAC